MTKRKKEEKRSETAASEDGEPLKFDGLSPEEALRGFMQVDREKVLEAEKRERERRRKGIEE